MRRMLAAGLVLICTSSFTGATCHNQECSDEAFAGESNQIENRWQTEPANGGNLNTPETLQSRLFIGSGARGNGHPQSRATTTFDCGSDGTSCEIKYNWSHGANWGDNERLVVKFSNGSDSETVTLVGADGSEKVRLSGCGTINVEVTVNPGTNAADVQTRYEFTLDRSRCDNC
jgi:hypothetical protein